MVRVSPIFRRCLGLVCALSLSIFIASSAVSGSIKWLTHKGYSPIMSCPKAMFSAGRMLDGDFCQIDVINTGEITKAFNLKADQLRGVCVNDDVLTCKLESSCYNVCEDSQGRTCPQAISSSSSVTDQPKLDCYFDISDHLTLTRECSKLSVRAFCDDEFTLPAGRLLAIRGLFAGCFVIFIIWAISEFCLSRARRQVSLERASGLALQSAVLPNVREHLRLQLRELWAEEAKVNRMYPESVISTTGKSAINSRDPNKRFQCQMWLRKLSMWRHLRTNNIRSFRPRDFLRSFALNVLFLSVLTASLYLVLKLSPVSVSSAAFPAWSWKTSVWLDFIIFADVLLDVFLFLVSVVTLGWPKNPTLKEAQTADDFATVNEAHSAKLRAAGESIDSGGFSTVTAPEPERPTSDTCLLIACHESSLTTSRAAVLRETLICALKIFFPSQIFVCDNGDAMSPSDSTWRIAKEVHPDIHYLYIPEGNKTFAFYWANHYWIPFLHQEGRCPDYKYVMIIDDDVPLPANLFIPREYLKLHPEVKAIHFPLTAASPSGESNLLLGCQDVEYKMSAAHKFFQSNISRALSCHGAVSLWERKAMDAVLYDHDTVFHGEDLYMGLSLLRLRDNSRILSCPQTVIPTYAPETFTMLFKQRVSSWELTSHKKTFTFLIELFSPSSFLHPPSLALKPYFLQEFLTIVLDWLRALLLVNLVMRDWRMFLFMSALFMVLLYFQVFLHQVVFLRHRRDLRSSISVLLVYPFYRLANLLFRLSALCQNVLVYSHDRKTLKIGFREDEVHDIPPCPPHPDVDWFNVWTAREQSARPASRIPSTTQPSDESE